MRSIFIKTEVIIYANPTTVKILGVASLDDAIGLSALNHVPEGLEEIVKQRMAHIYETGESAGMVILPRISGLQK